MSWAEIKKAVNSDLGTPLDALIKSLVGFKKSTSTARSALVALGFTQRMTMTAPDGTTIYGYWKNASVKSCSWDEAKEICDNYWKEINNWANEQGYGNICIFSRMPAYTDTGSWLPSGDTGQARSTVAAAPIIFGTGRVTATTTATTPTRISVFP